MKKTKFLLLASAFAITSQIFANTEKDLLDRCARLLNGQPNTSPTHAETENVISYLSRLIERQVISDKELERFLNNLNDGKIQNPIEDEDAAVQSALLIHQEGLRRLLDSKGLDIVRLKNWTIGAIKDKSRIHERQTQAAEETTKTYQAIELSPVPPHTFRAGRGDNIEVSLTHNIEVMSTLVTQWHWVQLFGENPSQHVKGDRAVSETIGGKKIELQPDHPVESITWWSAVIAANKLSEKSGFKPAYDFSAITWKPNTRAEDGSLEPLSGELKINAPNGDIYLAEGFRLPTEAEFLNLRILETEQNKDRNFDQRAWYMANSEHKTHAVGLLRPLIVNGKDIYDIIGNVRVWCQDRHETVFRGGKNPSGPTTGNDRVVYGGAWTENEMSLSPRRRSYESARSRSSALGVRFVRTVF